MEKTTQQIAQNITARNYTSDLRTNDPISDVPTTEGILAKLTVTLEQDPFNPFEIRLAPNARLLVDKAGHFNVRGPMVVLSDMAGLERHRFRLVNLLAVGPITKTRPKKETRYIVVETETLALPAVTTAEGSELLPSSIQYLETYEVWKDKVCEDARREAQIAPEQAPPLKHPLAKSPLTIVTNKMGQGLSPRDLRADFSILSEEQLKRDPDLADISAIFKKWHRYEEWGVMHFDITKDPTAVRLEEAVKKPWCPYKSVGWLKNALQEFDAPFLETDWVTPAACEYLTKLQQEKEQSRLRARNPKQNRPQLSAKTSCLAPTLLEKIVANIEKSLRLWETGFFRRLKELLRDENT